MPQNRKSGRTVVFVMVSAWLAVAPVHGQTADALAVTPSVVGVLVKLTKNQTKNTGAVTIQPNGTNAKAMTFNVTEATQFEYFNQVNTWGTNFLAEHRGQTVAIFTAAGSKPPAAAKVQILLPKPQPRQPGPPPQPQKPTWVHGTVTEVKDDAITIKLANPTPPPVRGHVTDVGVSENNSVGVITVRAGNKLQTFTVNPTTDFQKLKGKDRTSVSFLSIDRGQLVEIYPRYGAAHAASKVDVLVEKGAAAAAVKYTDHFLKFVAKPATAFQIDRDGKLTPAAALSVHKGELVAIMPNAMHSDVAAQVKITANQPAGKKPAVALKKPTAPVAPRPSVQKQPKSNVKPLLRVAPRRSEPQKKSVGPRNPHSPLGEQTLDQANHDYYNGHLKATLKSVENAERSGARASSTGRTTTTAAIATRRS